MTDFLTPSNIVSIFAILGSIFAVFLYFKTPQNDEERKAEVLATQVRLTADYNQKKFEDIQANVKEAFLLASNHTHTIEVHVQKLDESVQLVAIQLAKLQTIIEERIPKK